MENLAAFSAREVKRASAEEKERGGIPLQKDLRVKVKGKIIQMRFLKIAGRWLFVGVKDQRKRDC